MLVLSRKTNESIIIGENIEILIVEIKGDQVKLGINAPKDVTLYRGEIYDAIQKENKEAANSMLTDDIQSLLRKKKK
ncbi:MAG: carbon storage regulator CsrA [Spirochaetia bacterium]|nr:carbon storage regulator CsrA [Spirochaetia bacterium]